MKFFTNTSTDPYFNMAFDEYFLENHDSAEPVFYLWRNRPSVIIGLNQNAYSEVNINYTDSHGILLARRVTGGGAVYHDLQNLNYSIIGREISPEPVVEALRTMGVPAELTGRNDIHVEGRKVSGYARRVWHDREIIHGTLMYNVDIDTLVKALDTPGSKMQAKGIASIHSRVANLKDYLPGIGGIEGLTAGLHELLAGGDSEIPLDGSTLEAIRRLADEKFSTWDWIYGSSREVSLTRSGKLACGTVEAGIYLDHGRILEIKFSGDFIGDLPADMLEERLKGVRFERNEIASALGDGVASCFEGADAGQLADLITDKHQSL